ncbi:sigma-70 family RNA polymerase sigma factor [Paludisphaera soli]|uniref:sigma-70 family RNA polymerase sigma factor n=1 Tax=Paludisphaera soli TaxID=2712865 RepID=UPI0013EB9D4C|nr:sigma-70 family RNA polymerase sigma factor [Paludisphaera soli]
MLDLFLRRGDESAFEALVGRHGPMVRGVCRRLLASPHDADDAFQATFLVLVRKGGRLRDPDRLGPWLHGVATREALKARAARRGDRALPDVPCQEGAAPGAEWSDVMPIIDSELARLPAKHREVLVACLLDGATVEEASRRLDCPVGTVKSRLSRAREALRARLTSRGVAPAVALSALAGEASAFASPVSSNLIRATLTAVAARAASPSVATLLAGVAPTMISKSTLSALVVVGLGVAGLASATWTAPPPIQVEPPRGTPASASSPASAETDDARRQARNLKEILLAAVNHEAANGYFPPPAIQGDAGPLLSWRVAILPYLGQMELYREFHLNERWDSPHNKTLIGRMPAVFETPASPAPRGFTRFRGVAGEGSVFDPKLGPQDAAQGGRSSMMGMGGMMGAADMDGGMGMMMGSPPPSPGRRGVLSAEILDGTSNTVFAVVARDATPWTKPGELPFVPGEELPALDDSDPRGYLLGPCYGEPRLLKKDRPDVQAVLTALISRAGGEIISSDVFADPDPAAAEGAGAARSNAAAPASGSPSMEERLRSVEEKLDRLLKRFEGS